MPIILKIASEFLLKKQWIHRSLFHFYNLEEIKQFCLAYHKENTLSANDFSKDMLRINLPVCNTIFVIKVTVNVFDKKFGFRSLKADGI